MTLVDLSIMSSRLSCSSVVARAPTDKVANTKSFTSVRVPVTVLIKSTRRTVVPRSGALQAKDLSRTKHDCMWTADTHLGHHVTAPARRFVGGRETNYETLAQSSHSV